MNKDGILFYERNTEPETPYPVIAQRHGFSVDSVRSRVSRFRRELTAENQQLQARVIELEAQLAAKDDEDVFGHDLGKPWRLEGDVVIAGDIHANTINTDFMQRPLDIAVQYLERPRRFIIAGDFLNGDGLFWWRYDCDRRWL